MIVIADTSPINYLVQLGHHDILHKLYGQITIPTVVLSELTHPSTPGDVRNWALDLPDWVSVADPVLRLQSELDELDPGERAAIELVLESNADLLLIDESRGRRIAVLIFGISVRGVLGVLQDAHVRGLLDANAVFARLVSETNFHVSSKLRQTFLASLAEPSS